MRSLFLLSCFGAIFFIQTGFACTLAVKPIGKFDETEYIFIGEVIGYTESFPFKESLIDSALSSTNLPNSNNVKKASGLIVKIKESVFLPRTPKTHFEVFSYELYADCSVGGIKDYLLKRDFPLNSEIRIIAKEAKYLPVKLPNRNIRLENRPDELGSIALNYDKDKNRMTSANSVFDYKSFKYDMNEDSDSKYFLPNFEIRKDLLRLKNSQTQKERTEILNRFLDVPICCGYLDFHTLFKTYSSNEVEFKQLFETRLQKEMTKEEFDQYKIVNEVFSELAKLGYEEKIAEEAVGQAISEGTEISKQKLLERSLQILQKKK